MEDFKTFLNSPNGFLCGVLTIAIGATEMVKTIKEAGPEMDANPSMASVGQRRDLPGLDQLEVPGEFGRGHALLRGRSRRVAGMKGRLGWPWDWGRRIHFVLIFLACGAMNVATFFWILHGIPRTVSRAVLPTLGSVVQLAIIYSVIGIIHHSTRRKQTQPQR